VSGSSCYWEVPMSKSKPTKREQSDAAYMKTEGLRGQIDAFDGVQGENPDHRLPLYDEGKSPPTVCPHCTKRMDAVVGGSWTHLKRWADDEEHNRWKLQCNQCGGIVIVSEDVWIQVRETAIKAFVDRSPDKTTYNKRKGMLSRDETRGAE
jgi:hypothetical protein